MSQREKNGMSQDTKIKQIAFFLEPKKITKIVKIPEFLLGKVSDEWFEFIIGGDDVIFVALVKLRVKLRRDELDEEVEDINAEGVRDDFKPARTEDRYKVGQNQNGGNSPSVGNKMKQ